MRSIWGKHDFEGIQTVSGVCCLCVTVMVLELDEDEI